MVMMWYLNDSMDWVKNVDERGHVVAGKLETREDNCIKGESWVAEQLRLAGHCRFVRGYLAVSFQPAHS